MCKGIQKNTELLQQFRVNNNITSKSHFEQNLIQSINNGRILVY